MLAIPDILSPAELARIRAALAAADWIDGNTTSGHQSARAKRNRQLDEDSPTARELGAIVLDALARSPAFVAAALPLKLYPPLFSRYEAGDGFDSHVDSAVRIRRGSDFRIRSDLSATLFLSDPADHDGGALIVETDGGEERVRLPAGHLVLYPASTVHRVEAVTRGTRLAAFFWVQSMVRSVEDRGMMRALDRSIQSLARRHGQADADIVRLTGVYHNLLRRFAEL